MKVNGNGCQGLIGHHSLERQPLLAHGPHDGVLARFDGLISALTREPSLHLGSGAGGLHERQPVAAGPRSLCLRRKNLDHVSVDQGRLERHKLAVDASSHTAVTHLSVDGVGKVDRGG